MEKNRANHDPNSCPNIHSWGSPPTSPALPGLECVTFFLNTPHPLLRPNQKRKLIHIQVKKCTNVYFLYFWIENPVHSAAFSGPVFRCFGSSVLQGSPSDKAPARPRLHREVGYPPRWAPWLRPRPPDSAFYRARPRPGPLTLGRARGGAGHCGRRQGRRGRRAAGSGWARRGAHTPLGQTSRRGRCERR